MYEIKIDMYNKNIYYSMKYIGITAIEKVLILIMRNDHDVDDNDELGTGEGIKKMVKFRT